MGRHHRVVGGLLNAAIAESYSQSIVVRVARCPKHRLEFKPVLVALTLLALSIASFIGGVMFVVGNTATVAVVVTVPVLFIAGLIVWRIKPRVHVVNFEGNFAWLTGFGYSYLESLPPYAEMVEATRQNIARSLEQLQDAEPEMEPENQQEIATAAPSSDEIDLTPAPQSLLDEGYWKSGEFVVLARGSRLPNRCCVCNEIIEDEIPPRTLTWTPNREGTLFKSRGLIGGKLIGSAIADSYSESIVVHAGRCPEHRFRMKPIHAVLILLAVAIAGFLCVLAYRNGQPLPNIAVSVVAVCVLITAIVRFFRPQIKVVRFQGNLAWLDGFAAPYVDSLPSYKHMIRAEAQKTTQTFNEIQ